MSTWHFFVRLCGCPWVPTSPTLHMFIYFVRVWFWVRLSLRRSVSSADFKCRPPLGPKFLFSPVLWHSDFYAFNYYLQFEPLPPCSSSSTLWVVIFNFITYSLSPPHLQLTFLPTGDCVIKLSLIGQSRPLFSLYFVFSSNNAISAKNKREKYSSSIRC